jgi:hypothetical protein
MYLFKFLLYLIYIYMSKNQKNAACWGFLILVVILVIYFVFGKKVVEGHGGGGGHGGGRHGLGHGFRHGFGRWGYYGGGSSDGNPLYIYDDYYYNYPYYYPPYYRRLYHTVY